MSGIFGAAIPTCTRRIAWEGKVRKFTHFDTELGHEICDEVLSGRAYPIPKLNGEVRRIVDIGANVGAATVYFALRFPHAEIFAFEPSSESFGLLATNTADLQKVRCYPFGLFDGALQATLRRGEEDPATSTIGESPEASIHGVRVHLHDAATTFADLRIDAAEILKIDTEGCELPILRSLASYLPRIGVLFVEFHSESDRLEIDRLVRASHVLFSGAIKHPCRGELCYVARHFFPVQVDKKYGIAI